MSLNEPLYPPPTILAGEQHEQGHEVVSHDQGEQNLKDKKHLVIVPFGFSTSLYQISCSF